MDHQDELVPHVLIFPLHIQSPINSMLKLAELLCLAGLHVTFLSTRHNERLLRCTNIQSRFARYQGRFHIETVEDGLPDEHPRHDLDASVKSIPGMEGLLRFRDLPDFCRRDCTADREAELVMAGARNIPRAAGIILNTFEALEGPFLPHINSQAREVYAVGPLQLHLKTRLAAQNIALLPLSNSFWEEDTGCLSWLDSQPFKLVTYISFGSLRNITKDEFLEIWHGIINSGQRFLWVIRPGSIRGQTLEQYDEFLKEMNRGTNEKGLIVSWALQEEELAHPAIGGFLTHSGWNSTLESIIGGVPMICWPQYVDRQVTSRLVSEMWNLGFDMKDTCDRSIIEEMVRDIVERNHEFDQTAEKLSKMARESVVEGGSSHFDLDRLVGDIKKLSTEGVKNGKVLS